MLFGMLVSLSIAQACAPDAEATAATLVRPGSASVADATALTGDITGIVEVHVAPSGSVSAASIYKSTGNMKLDQALLWGARRTTYSPKISSCKVVEGTYFYRVHFAPYSGDLAKTTARFSGFLETLIAANEPAQDTTVALDPAITPPESLHTLALYFSTLGALRKLDFLGDDFVQDAHRYHYRAVFEKGSSVVMFVLGKDDRLVGFLNEG